MFQQCVYEPPHPLHSINSLAGIFADSCAISNGAAFQALRSYQARLLQTVKLLVCMQGVWHGVLLRTEALLCISRGAVH